MLRFREKEIIMPSKHQNLFLRPINEMICCPFRKETTSEISLSFDRKKSHTAVRFFSERSRTDAQQAKKSDKIPSTFVTHVVLRS